MKLSKNYVVCDFAGEKYLIPCGERSGGSMVRLNSTAVFIVDQLKTDTTPTELARAVVMKYAAPVGMVTSNVADFLDRLRNIGALEE